jgi:hypothetical protein
MLMDVLNFTFQSAWHFIGILVLIIATGGALAEIIKAARRKT